MCQVNNAIMEETYKAEVECLRKLLIEKEKEVAQLKELLKECGNQLYEYSDVCLQEGYEIEQEAVNSKEVKGVRK